MAGVGSIPRSRGEARNSRKRFAVGRVQQRLENSDSDAGVVSNRADLCAFLSEIRQIRCRHARLFGDQGFAVQGSRWECVLGALEL